MKQEDKELLLRDLCARLPYGVYGNYLNSDGSLSDDKLLRKVKIGYHDLICADGRDGMVLDRFLKPYLFPLSSMTEEQYESLRESGILSNCSHSYEYVNPHIHGVSFIFKEFKTYSLELIEWLNKNHFDYRGLIEKGLAVNAINLNIY